MSNGDCTFCDKKENTGHLLFECEDLKETWTFIESVLNNIVHSP